MPMFALGRMKEVSRRLLEATSDLYQEILACFLILRIAPRKSAIQIALCHLSYNVPVDHLSS